MRRTVGSKVLMNKERTRRRRNGTRRENIGLFCVEQRLSFVIQRNQWQDELRIVGKTVNSLPIAVCCCHGHLDIVVNLESCQLSCIHPGDLSKSRMQDFLKIPSGTGHDRMDRHTILVAVVLTIGTTLIGRSAIRKLSSCYSSSSGMRRLGSVQKPSDR
jgi:hypothetical protein